jgi:hypothetical protein
LEGLGKILFRRESCTPHEDGDDPQVSIDSSRDLETHEILGLVDSCHPVRSRGKPPRPHHDKDCIGDPKCRIHGLLKVLTWGDRGYVLEYVVVTELTYESVI